MVKAKGREEVDKSKQGEEGAEYRRQCPFERFARIRQLMFSIRASDDRCLKENPFIHKYSPIGRKSSTSLFFHFHVPWSPQSQGSAHQQIREE
jgi:hypothetical protein